MQQLLFYSENKTWCSALVSFDVSTSQSTLALFSRMIVTLDFAVLSSEDMELATIGDDVLDEWGFCGSSLCSSAVRSAPRRGLGCSFCIAFFFVPFSFEEVGPNPRSDDCSEMFLFLISPRLQAHLQVHQMGKRCITFVLSLPRPFCSTTGPNVRGTEGIKGRVSKYST